MSRIRSEALIGRWSSYIVLAIGMTDKRQKATKVKCKREESLTKQSIFLECMQSPLEEAFEFYWSSLADEHNTLPKSTRRHLELDKFVFGTP